MLKRSLVFVCIALLAVSGASVLIAQPSGDEAMKIKQKNDKVDVTGPLFRALPSPKNTNFAGEAGRAARDKNVPVQIIYDDGIVTALPTISSYCWGNQFNTHNGAAVKSFSVTQLSFWLTSGAGTDAVFVSLYGPVNGTTAPFIDDILVTPNNGGGAFNTVTIGPYAGGGSFLAGVWYVAGDTVGLGSGTVNGQGHHGMAINDIAGTDFQTVPLNALVGAATAFIPVELMDFTVSDN